MHLWDLGIAFNLHKNPFISKESNLFKVGMQPEFDRQLVTLHLHLSLASFKRISWNFRCDTMGMFRTTKQTSKMRNWANPKSLLWFHWANLPNVKLGTFWKQGKDGLLVDPNSFHIVSCLCMKTPETGISRFFREGLLEVNCGASQRDTTLIDGFVKLFMWKNWISQLGTTTLPTLMQVRTRNKTRIKEV